MAENGFIAAAEEADELLEAAAGDQERLAALLERRLTGEPLAWVTGGVDFCGLRLRVDEGVYVPRWHSEPVAARAIERLPQDGVGVDVCTGCGALAAALRAARPGARVLATDADPAAVACARSNGVDARLGDLLDPIDEALAGRVDLVCGVVPYVPTGELGLLQRDTFTFERPLAYDGGLDGTTVLRRLLAEATRVLRPGGALVLELGGDEPQLLGADLDRLGYADVSVIRDEDSDVRGLEATLA